MTGFVLAGVGHRTLEGQNFLVVKNGIIYIVLMLSYEIADTEISVIEDAFRSYTQRNDVGIILINQHVLTSLNSC